MYQHLFPKLLHKPAFSLFFSKDCFVEWLEWKVTAQGHGKCREAQVSSQGKNLSFTPPLPRFGTFGISGRRRITLRTTGLDAVGCYLPSTCQRRVRPKLGCSTQAGSGGERSWEVCGPPGPWLHFIQQPQHLLQCSLRGVPAGPVLLLSVSGQAIGIALVL